MMYRRYTVKQLSELAKLIERKDTDLEFEKARIALEHPQTEYVMDHDTFKKGMDKMRKVVM